MKSVSRVLCESNPEKKFVEERDQLSRKFFNSTLQPTSPLHSLLPPPLDQLPPLAYEQPQNSQ